MPNPTTLQERVHIVQLSEAGLTDPLIAQEIGRSIHTVRKWRRRGTRHGREALASKMGRPVQGALHSCSSEAVRERVLAWRKAHPGWGPKTLRAELGVFFSEDASSSSSSSSSLPSSSSIGRFLKEEGLITRTYEKHSALPTPDPPYAATSPHQIWRMDAKGNDSVPNVGYVAL